MKKLSHAAAVATLGLACALPVMAQGSASSSTASPATSATASPSTMDASSNPSTPQMGAGPAEMDRPAERNDGDRDLGWIGLLGLAGLLGLRRKHHDHVERTDYRANANVR